MPGQNNLPHIISSMGSRIVVVLIAVIFKNKVVLGKKHVQAAVRLSQHPGAFFIERDPAVKFAVTKTTAAQTIGQAGQHHFDPFKNRAASVTDVFQRLERPVAATEPFRLPREAEQFLPGCDWL